MAETEPQEPVGIVCKISHPRGPQLTKDCIEWLSSRGIEFRLDSETAQGLDLQEIHQERLTTREKIATTCPIIMVLGGDGTLISVSRHAGEKAPIVIGVNLGSLGFLTEISADDIFDTLESVLEGQATLWNRRLLQAKVARATGESETFQALNDVVITKEALARIFGIDLYVNGDFAANLRGDGLIIATPGGSTAYSLSAGGSIVHPKVSAVLVSPICPHSLTSRPLVLPEDFEIKLVIATADKGKQANSVFLTVDGQEGRNLSDGEEITITTTRNSVLFAKSPSLSYFDVLSEKLNWGSKWQKG